MKYRADIDGLRAIAVLSVVVYHAGQNCGLHWLPGGYIGVDIFFVISGFLITNLIVNDLEGSRFSLVDFWNRRIKRIFPALFVVLATTALAAYFVLIPSEFAAFGRSLQATALFFSNVYFANQIGYFAGGAEDQPLLHTWSLSVEEQFYIIWPVALWALVKLGLRRWLLLIIALGWIGSFALSVWFLPSKPEGVFFLLPTRAWELLTGALLAVARLPAPKSRVVSELASAVGLALIGYALITYKAAVTPFPGANALAPCLGAALMIYGGSREGSLGNRLLSLRPMVFVGLISYSLYLWHWPLLVLPRLYLLRPLTPVEAVGLMLVAAALAYLSLILVERPIRSIAWGRVFKVPKPVVLGAAGYAAVALIGGTFAATKGLAFTASERTLHAQAGLKPELERLGKCFQNPRRVNMKAFDACEMKLAGNPSNGGVWLMGDSHAGSLFPAVVDAVQPKFARLHYRLMASCSPLSGVDIINMNSPGGGLQNCRRYTDAMLDVIARDQTSKYVVLAGRWNSYTRADPIYLQRPGGGPLTHEETIKQLEYAIDRTVRKLTDAGKIVILIDPVPEYARNEAKCFVRAVSMSRDAQLCAEAGAEVRERSRVSEEVIARVVARNPSVRLVETKSVLCGSDRCAAWRGDELLYVDHNHLTARGARLLAPAIRAQLD
ncbi:acyltransferase family protein [Caulobacter sp.]|uniref:acyltransferase family protein n=1 Tax=Caulobacter sp. TaxID=78 RepID=UPI003BB1ACC1